jgi:fructose 1,6-bisphosphate aldolase/phosphatase
MDVAHTEGERVIELNAPQDLYSIAALLRDTERFVVESVWSRVTGEQAVAAATLGPHDIAGKYTGKDDPVMLVRVHKDFPATGEVLAPHARGPCVAGCMRGSHQMPLMAVPLASGSSHFDGPPVMSCAAFSMRDGLLTGPVDGFAHPFWDAVRERVSHKAVDTRRQGFSAPPCCPGPSSSTPVSPRSSGRWTSASRSGRPDGGHGCLCCPPGAPGRVGRRLRRSDLPRADPCA